MNFDADCAFSLNCRFMQTAQEHVEVLPSLAGEETWDSLRYNILLQKESREEKKQKPRETIMTRIKTISTGRFTSAAQKQLFELMSNGISLKNAAAILKRKVS